MNKKNEEFDPCPRVSVSIRGDSKERSSLRLAKKLGHIPDKYRDISISELPESEVKKILDECNAGLNDYRHLVGIPVPESENNS